MHPIRVDRVAEAADVLAQAMVDEPLSRWLLPDHNEFLVVHRHLFEELIRLALDEGRVDTWGDPIAGVAVWLHRPAVVRGQRAQPSLRGASPFPTHARERVERFATVIRRARERARPDEHAYLDTIAVLPEFRRRGIATSLLESGHTWADGEGLPCALETETERNVAFYAGRGYAVAAELPLPASGLTITSMRRPAVNDRRPHSRLERARSDLSRSDTLDEYPGCGSDIGKSARSHGTRIVRCRLLVM